MQKDLQAQIEEIRLLLETHAAEASSDAWTRRRRRS